MVIGHTETISKKNKTDYRFSAHLAIDYQQGLNNSIVNTWATYQNKIFVIDLCVQRIPTEGEKQQPQQQQKKKH